MKTSDNSKHHQRLSSEIAEKVSQFINEQSNRQSLITITNVKVSNDDSVAVCYVSIIPDEQSSIGLAFLKRKTFELKQYLQKNTRWRRIPNIRFEIDDGEKNRQKIEEISKNLKEEEE